MSLGRWDIAVHVMTLSGFCIAPRKGHLDGVKRIIGFLSKMRFGVTRFHVEATDYSDLNDPVQYSVGRILYTVPSRRTSHTTAP